MQKKIQHLIGIIGKKNLIAICALLALTVVVSVGIAISNNASKDDKKTNAEAEESTGLQVEENADDVEGDSIDFSEFLSEDEKNDSSKNQEGSGNKKSDDETTNSGLTPDDNPDSGSGEGTGNGEGTGSGEGSGSGNDSDQDNTTSSGSEFGQLF